MKRVIRRCVWETNSSMTHACVIMPADKAILWQNQNLYYYNGIYWNLFNRYLSSSDCPVVGNLYSEEEVVELLKKINIIYNPDEWEEYGGFVSFLRENDLADIFFSCEMWTNDDWMEWTANLHTTPGGEKIVVYCKYGRDG